jgi:hypothetical protein
MLRNIFTLAVLATAAVCVPLDPTSTSAAAPAPTPTRPTRSCVIVDGKDSLIIANYTRPACVCNCLRSTCEGLTARHSICALGKLLSANSWAGWYSAADDSMCYVALAGVGGGVDGVELSVYRTYGCMHWCKWTDMID